MRKYAGLCGIITDWPKRRKGIDGRSSWPLCAGAESDREAGIKLLERLKREELDIPVIICSTGNFESVASEVLGTVYYNPNRDLNWDLKEILGKL